MHVSFCILDILLNRSPCWIKIHKNVGQMKGKGGIASGIHCGSVLTIWQREGSKIVLCVNAWLVIWSSSLTCKMACYVARCIFLDGFSKHRLVFQTVNNRGWTRQCCQITAENSQRFFQYVKIWWIVFVCLSKDSEYLYYWRVKTTTNNFPKMSRENSMKISKSVISRPSRYCDIECTERRSFDPKIFNATCRTFEFRKSILVCAHQYIMSTEGDSVAPLLTEKKKLP